MTPTLAFALLAVLAGIATSVQSAANAGLVQRIGFGASLVVNSGIRLLERARRRRLPVVIVNRGVTRADARASVKIDAGTSEVLRALADGLPALA